jgi:hypothetical protein
VIVHPLTPNRTGELFILSSTGDPLGVPEDKVPLASPEAGDRLAASQAGESDDLVVWPSGVVAVVAVVAVVVLRARAGPP